MRAMARSSFVVLALVSALCVLAIPTVAAASDATETPDATEIRHPSDERWLTRPLSVGLATIFAAPQRADLFLVWGAELEYAVPYVSFGATLGYLDGLDASLSVRPRWHLGHAVALTLLGRAALAPLGEGCTFVGFGDGGARSGCDASEWRHALFLGLEPGLEGRTESGFVWRVSSGVWGLLARSGASCTHRQVGASQPDLPCTVETQGPGVVSAMSASVGWAL